MGVYCYTLRKGTKQVDEVTIGRLAYAYKCHWREDDSPFCRRMHAAAERARDANPDLELVVIGDDYSSARSEDRTPVFQISKQRTYWLDGNNPGPVVGHLGFEKGRYRYFPVDA